MNICHCNMVPTYDYYIVYIYNLQKSVLSESEARGSTMKERSPDWTDIGRWCVSDGHAYYTLLATSFTGTLVTKCVTLL